MSSVKHRAPLEPQNMFIAVSINIWSLRDRCAIPQQHNYRTGKDRDLLTVSQRAE